jgi:2-polyprenyl-3-methyl-5-hydroxy-6-metoxy-1,4-benzoquinol methylase
MTQNIQKINTLFDNIIKNLLDIKKEITKDSNDETTILEAKKEPNNNVATESLPSKSVAPVEESLEDFDSLKKALESDKWPEAVNPNLICDPDNETDKLERGRGIVELMIEPDLKDLRVLDLGCGEGQVAFVASEYEPKIVVGYDVKENEKWKEFKKDKLVYTTNFDEVLENGPYDVVVMFDVLDHVKDEDAISLLKKASKALDDDGQIYMRCHPFVAKHGTHLYHQLNKAYAHLVFTKDEIKKLITDDKYVEETIEVKYPISTYLKFIESSGLKIANRRDITSKVDPFFKIPKIAERIIKNTGMDQFPEFQMSLDFIDFVLKK